MRGRAFRVALALACFALSASQAFADGGIFVCSTPFDANARVLRLDPPEGAQPIYLMRGDENAVFFIDQVGKLGIGNRDFNYTRSRRLNNL